MTGMIRVALSPEDRAQFRAMRGRVVVASHPTLIDVVILLALLPDTTAVAKAAAGRNFFYSRVVNAAFLVNDNPLHVLEEAKDLLARGGNLVIFPEGTRTPVDAPRHKLHRGAAQIALHAGAPVQCVSLACDPPVLAKGQPPWDVGDRIITFTLRACALAVRLEPGRGATCCDRIGRPCRADFHSTECAPVSFDAADAFFSGRADALEAASFTLTRV